MTPGLVTRMRALVVRAPSDVVAVNRDDLQGLIAVVDYGLRVYLDDAQARARLEAELVAAVDQADRLGALYDALTDAVRDAGVVDAVVVALDAREATS